MSVCASPRRFWSFPGSCSMYRILEDIDFSPDFSSPHRPSTIKPSSFALAAHVSQDGRLHGTSASGRPCFSLWDPPAAEMFSQLLRCSHLPSHGGDKNLVPVRPSCCPRTSVPPWVCFCRYWHRSLNPRKLIEVKFSHLSRNMTMQRTMKLYRLPEVGAAGTGSGG